VHQVQLPLQALQEFVYSTPQPKGSQQACKGLLESANFLISGLSRFAPQSGQLEHAALSRVNVGKNAIPKPSLPGKPK
ncbi:MAG TPA: hypothetical protein VFS41_01140, partial [Edaphobacter sp.]|nr:hypothetical protein [Edaphobacter sp.]